MTQLDIGTNRNKESWKQSGVIQLDIGTNRNKESWKQSVRGDAA